MPLEGGHDLRLEMGHESMTRFADMIGRMTIDDAAMADDDGPRDTSENPSIES